MKCMYCQGTMERKTAPFQINRKGYHLVLSAIPAWVCAQCGEVYFEEAEVEAIQGALQDLDERTEKLALAA
ncbi:YgiT-type zinc finger protein [candidate division KSB1 bacterium]|nr:YgiT-type zinc finger protein [candidate division KSB1 bacterium]